MSNDQRRVRIIPFMDTITYEPMATVRFEWLTEGRVTHDQGHFFTRKQLLELRDVLQDALKEMT